MTTHRLRAACISLSLLSLLPACGGPTSSPEGAIEASTDALVSNDIGAWIELTMTPAQQEDLRASWEKLRKSEPTAREREQFDAAIKMLTAKDADAQLFASLQPQLVQIQGQFGWALTFAPMMLANLAGGEPEAQLAAQEFAASLANIDLTDEAKLKQAIHCVTQAAKKLKIDDFEELRGLSFDKLTSKGSTALAGIKGVLQVYGLDLDATLESIETKVIAEEGNSALVEVRYALFGGAKSSMQMRMIKSDDGWTPAN